MNLIAHTLTIFSPTGILLTSIHDRGFAGLNYGLKENEPGVLELKLFHGFNMDFLKIDGLIEIHRKGYGVDSLEGDTAWFIRKIIVTENDIQVTAYSALSLVGRRLIAYHTGTSFAEKISIPWDGIMREFVNENMGTAATDTDRDLSPWFTVPSATNKGTAYSKAAAWRNLLSTLLEIVDDVRGSGIKCSIDVILVSAATFEFRVFIGPRGSDHSDTSDYPVIISKKLKNLAESSVEENWESEANFVYATGQGNGSNKMTATSSDSSRISISPFNRQEFNQQARSASTTVMLQAEADYYLEAARPFRVFDGVISQNQGCLYGLHWKWGDIVVAEQDGFGYNCYVESVTVTVDENGNEIVEGRLRSITDVDR